MPSVSSGWGVACLLADLKALGVKVPKTVPKISYTPVDHHPMPYSLVIDLDAKRVVKRIIGVMPNATYKGKIYAWDEFCALLRTSRTEGTGDPSPEEKGSEDGRERLS